MLEKLLAIICDNCALNEENIGRCLHFLNSIRGLEKSRWPKAQLFGARDFEPDRIGKTLKKEFGFGLAYTSKIYISEETEKGSLLLGNISFPPLRRPVNLDPRFG